MRLIDANALWAEFMELADTSIEFDGEGVANAIANAPTIDAEEVIRCEECKHWWKKNELCAHPKCRTGMVCVTEAPPNHYCGYGERREGE